MNDFKNVNRRGMLFGLGAAGLGAAAAPAFAGVARPTVDKAPQTFEAKSTDGTTLVGDIVGAPGAPEILFIHGLRQSRLSWDRQYNDPALAGFRKVRFDLRGHGDSDKPVSPGSYADMGRYAPDRAINIMSSK